MSTIPISGNAASTNASSTSSTSSTSSSGALGESDFLTLLIAQLKNQDPMNPTDNTQFVSELATFSSLQQQTTMTQSIQQESAEALIGAYVADDKGNSGQVVSVSNDSTNGMQLTINETQTSSSGTTSTVPVTINYSDVTTISNTASGLTTTSSTTSSS